MKRTTRSLSLILAILMLLSVMPMTALAAEAAVKTYGAEDFEGYAVGDKVVSSAAMPTGYNKILEEDGNRFLRMPITCVSTSAPKTTPTNRGKMGNHQSRCLLHKRKDLYQGRSSYEWYQGFISTRGYLALQNFLHQCVQRGDHPYL